MGIILVNDFYYVSRPAENVVSIKPLPGGRFLLYGYALGERIRVRSRNLNTLLTRQNEIHTRIAAQLAQLAPVMTPARQAKAEAREIKAQSGGYDIDEMIERGLRGWTKESVECVKARANWLASQTDRHLFKRTTDNNKSRTNGFIAFLAERGKTTLDQVHAEDCEQYVLQKGVTQRTQVTRGRVVRAWLNYCVTRGHLRESPFKVDLEDLSERAPMRNAPRILSPEQCLRLVCAAKGLYGGELLPYVALALFCFLRHAEAVRTTPEQVRLTGKIPVIEVWPRKRGTVSYRKVDVPRHALTMLFEPVVFSKAKWAVVREAAGLVKLGPRPKGGGVRKITSDVWQENILRHTGISYHYQIHGDIKETTRQAGNSSDVAFRHYLALPAEGAADKFYGL